MKTITKAEIKHSINLMKNDWEAHEDTTFIKAMRNHLIQEINILEDEEKADN